MQRFAKSLEDRFWSHVDKRGPHECWEWQASLEHSGYGRMSGDRRGNKKILAHRYSYMLHTGEEPGELLVCHTCDNPKCVNPSHLWLGTCAQNHADRNQKARQARGEKQGSAKLTAGDVAEIRRRAAGGEPQAWIAREFHISKSQCGNVVHGRHWRHV